MGVVARFNIFVSHTMIYLPINLNRVLKNNTDSSLQKTSFLLAPVSSTPSKDQILKEGIIYPHTFKDS